MACKLLKKCAVCVTVTWLTVWFGADVQATVTYQTVALTSDAAPGTGSGVVYSLFSNPVIDDTGQTAFWGLITGTGVGGTNDTGIWSEASGALSLVARTGSAAPGTAAGVVYIFMSTPVLNGAGQTAFHSSLTGTGVDSTNDRGIWSERSGALALVAREGDAVPGTAAGVVYTSFITGSPVFNDAGQTAFTGYFNGPGVNITNNQGIWSEGSGVLSLVARKGSAAPGTSAGVVYSFFFINPVLNGSGQTAFWGKLTGTGVNVTNNTGIWSQGSGVLGLIARSGSTAPGTAAGVVFASFDGPKLNGAGQTAFWGSLTGTDVDNTNDTGIWSEGSGVLALVARKGSAAPDTAQGVVFTSFGNDPILNDAGQIAFRGALTGTGVDGTNDTGIWSEGSGALALVARSGDAAPGTPAGVMYGRMNTPVLNGSGQTAFKSNLTGTGVTTVNNWGIWATDSAGVLTLVARAGDLFDVNDDPLIDDLRTISLLALTVNSGGGDGYSTSFNDDGQLAFKLNFTDGSQGIFVATIGGTLPGDLDADGFVGIDDLNRVLGNWNQNVPPADPLADPTGDGFVGIADLNIVLGNWNAGTPPASGTSIPEPTSLALSFGAFSALARRQRQA